MGVHLGFTNSCRILFQFTCVLVGLEVRESEDDALGVEGSADGTHAYVWRFQIDGVCEES